MAKTVVTEKDDLSNAEEIGRLRVRCMALESLVVDVLATLRTSAPEVLNRRLAGDPTVPNIGKSGTVKLPKGALNRRNVIVAASAGATPT